MTKEQLINKLNYIIYLINSTPELFHDGINEDIKSLLKDIINNLVSKGVK